METQFRNLDVARWPQAVRFEFEREDLPDEHGGALDWMDEEEDAERLNAYRRGEWSLIGVRAKVTAFVPIGQGSFSSFELTSPGVWSIESDSSEDFLNETYEEERDGLLAALRLMGLAALSCEVLHA
jgi:hypothetical protein